MPPLAALAPTGVVGHGTNHTIRTSISFSNMSRDPEHSLILLVCHSVRYRILTDEALYLAPFQIKAISGQAAKDTRSRTTKTINAMTG
jgi:hypothetical protein